MNLFQLATQFLLAVPLSFKWTCFISIVFVVEKWFQYLLYN